MRVVVDTLVALMIAGVLAGVVIHHRSKDEHVADAEGARLIVNQIERELTLKGSLGEVETTRQGFPTTVDPAWFGETVPLNPLFVDTDHPWIEIAPYRDRALNHPASRTALTREMASFWYNPYKGIVRARVPAAMTDVAAKRLYDSVNGISSPNVSADEQPIAFDG